MPETRNPAPGATGDGGRVDTDQRSVDSPPEQRLQGRRAPITVHPAGADLFGDLQSAGIQALQAMPEIETIPGFDYTALPPDVGAEAKAAADRIKERMRGAIIETGRDLLAVKDRLEHGQFGKWLSAEFGLTARTARNYMAAAELASKSETVSVLRPKILYLLAAPSTPESARQDVINRLDRGEAIADRAVKQIIADAKFQEKQEQKRAVQARRAKSARRSKGQHEAEQARLEIQLRREREQRDANTETVARIFANRLQPDELSLIAEIFSTHAVHLIGACEQAKKLANAGGLGAAP